MEYDPSLSDIHMDGVHTQISCTPKLQTSLCQLSSDHFSILLQNHDMQEWKERFK